MFQRNLTSELQKAVSDTPTVLLVGARQTGKSTLVQQIRNEGYQPDYITFDDPTALAAAKANPTAFIQALNGPVIFDEVQRVPDLFLAIKAQVDKERTSGGFLLTGSANVLLIPKVADSLAGRIEILTLRTLSQGEMEGRNETFIDRVCGKQFELSKKVEAEDRKDLFERMLTGGYPEAVERRSIERRDKWFRSYVTTLLQRDVRDLANIEGLTELPRLLSILAARAGGLLNTAEISRSSGIPQTSLKRYMALLEQVFLIETLQPYSGSLTKRLVRSPKLYFTDTGLVAMLQGLTWERIKFEPSLGGPLLENFVVNELRKQMGWNKTAAGIFHFRTSSDQEVDIVLETASGEVVGIEIKSAASVGNDAFKGLRILKDSVGRKFLRGFVLYTGDSSVAFEEGMFAVPVQNLWQ